MKGPTVRDRARVKQALGRRNGAGFTRAVAPVHVAADAQHTRVTAEHLGVVREQVDRDLALRERVDGVVRPTDRIGEREGYGQPGRSHKQESKARASPPMRATRCTLTCSLLHHVTNASQSHPPTPSPQPQLGPLYGQ